MTLVSPLIGLFIASLANAVPSNDAFHPCRTSSDLVEADIAGSGREMPVARALRPSTRDDQPAATTGRDWRAMAQRCRSLAAWHTGHSREMLLRLAQEYEQRAQGAPHAATRDAEEA
ncbi:MAG: hypothetical protein JO021_20375 [Alphaproteobacteria bacterium]|nr:hypothetical protein [Alphaproteobacteria bacterium]